jgi:hypothetical protein
MVSNKKIVGDFGEFLVDSILKFKYGCQTENLNSGKRNYPLFDLECTDKQGVFTKKDSKFLVTVKSRYRIYSDYENIDLENDKLVLFKPEQVNSLIKTNKNEAVIIGVAIYDYDNTKANIYLIKLEDYLEKASTGEGRYFSTKLALGNGIKLIEM